MRSSLISVLFSLLFFAADTGAGPAGPPVDYAARVLASLNHYRASHGLPPLQVAPSLSTLAAEHSYGMSTKGRPSHDGFSQRFARAGGYLCVENVAHGFRVPEQVTLGWRASPAHQRNLLDHRVRYAGVANDGWFVTFFACDETA